MATMKQNVTIKGTKDGLVFLLNDTCSFEELLEEIRSKLENSHQQILTGPIIHVHLKLGARVLTGEEKSILKSLMKTRGNLILQSIESDVVPSDPFGIDRASIHVVHSIVRSGQILEHDGHVMLMGDVNPGGTIRASGDIYVMGSLRGVAHAGFSNHDEAIIAASHMDPMQLRIAQVISRPPDEWIGGGLRMEFAYLQDGKMSIEKISLMHKIRPGQGIRQGEVKWV